MNRKQFIKRTVLGIAIAPFIPIWDLITQAIWLATPRINTIVSNDPKEEKRTVTIHGYNEKGEPVTEEITLYGTTPVTSKFRYKTIL